MTNGGLLEHLILIECCNLTDDSIKKMNSSSLSKFKDLNLSRCYRLTDDGMNFIFNKYAPTLKDLTWQGAKFVGFDKLASLQRFQFIDSEDAAGKINSIWSCIDNIG